MKKNAKYLRSVVLGIVLIWLSCFSDVKADNNEYGLEAYNCLNIFTNNFQNRLSGSEACMQGGEWISSVLSSYGYSVEKFEFQPSVYFADYVATKQGSSAETIYIGASYDSIESTGGLENAASTAVLLELAKRFAGTDTYYTIKFCFWGASEGELQHQGAQNYMDVIMMGLGAQNTAVCYIDLDGVAGGDNLYVYSGFYDENGNLREDWAGRWAMNAAERAGILLNYLPEDESGEQQSPAYLSGESSVFQEKKIAYVGFSSGVWENGQKIDSALEYFSSSGGMITGSEYDSMANLETILPGRLQYQMTSVSMIVSQMLREMTADNLTAYGAEYMVGEPVSESSEESINVDDSDDTTSNQEIDNSDREDQNNIDSLDESNTDDSQEAETGTGDSDEASGESFQEQNQNKATTFENLFQIVIVVIVVCLIASLIAIFFILKP
ncbi:MAG: M28 family peptidase [Lachnospiraceae bacterium]